MRQVVPGWKPKYYSLTIYPDKMKDKILLSLTVITLIFTSCTEIKRDGDWDDVIQLSKKSAEFNAIGDSVSIITGGDWWWITDISVNGTYDNDFSNVNMESESDTITQDDISIQRRDKNTLFIKVDSNPLNTNRIITVGLEAGDYFDRVTITQKSN
jgi:hypothetical protein